MPSGVGVRVPSPAPAFKRDETVRKKLYCCDDYEVDSDGYIVSKRFGTPLKHSINPKGYQIINVQINKKPKGVAVHIAIARAFVPGYKPGLEVNHKDGNKQNNRPENLEWVTRKENARHSVDVLGNNVGSKNHHAKSIRCLDISGNLVDTYGSISEAAKAVCGDLNYCGVKNCIWRALTGRRKTYRGYVWKYENASIAQ